jgi:hypothetical protein
MNNKLAPETEPFRLLHQYKPKAKDTQHVYFSARKNSSRQCCVIISTVMSPPISRSASSSITRGFDSDSGSPSQHTARQYHTGEFAMDRTSSADSSHSQAADCQESLSDYAFMMELDDNFQCPV